MNKSHTIIQLVYFVETPPENYHQSVVGYFIIPLLLAYYNENSLPYYTKYLAFVLSLE